jgi:tetratricopeptide (TPR) repeat protein
MNFHRNPLFPAIGLAAAAIIMTVPARGQELALGELVDQGLAAMNAGKWQESLALHTEAVERFGKNNPLMLFGPQFGVIYYRKGICEMKLKKWQDAMASFEICYRDFPNKPDTAIRNNFNKLALLKWGEAAMGEGNWDLAITQFKKFIAEREPRDRYPQGTFHVNLAICQYNAGLIPDGNENLEIAIKNKESFLTADSAIVAGFQALVTAAIDKQNEQAVIDFVNANRGGITIEPYEMHRYSKVFMKLAGDAVNVGMHRAALTLYQLVPSTGTAIDDVRARLNSLATARGVKDGANMVVRADLEKELADLENQLSGDSATEMIKLAAVAFIHEHHGNVRGAHAAFDQLETHYPKAARREDNLYNLVRTSSLIGESAATQTNADKFVKAFPESKYIPAVRRMQLSSLFFSGEYELCIEVAEPLLDTLQEGTDEHDMCLHVLGGSYFYTGAYDKARELLDQHVAKYPKSIFKVSALYFQAANESRLQFWSKAARLLDDFLAKYPDPAENIYMPFALFDRATCHYAEDQNELALEKLAVLLKDFPNTTVADQAWNLRGNIQQVEGELEAAGESYMKALEIAEATNNRIVAGESLYYLVGLLGEQKDEEIAAKACGFADKYWKEYAEGSPFTAQVAVAQMAPMTLVGRNEEALNRLQGVISQMAKEPEASGLEAAINSYTKAYLENKSPEELKEHYYNFPDIRMADKAARALLRIAIIGVFEDVAKKTEDTARRNSANAMIGVLFQELKRDFVLTDLTNFILVKLGDYLRTNTSVPREALPYYDEILGRQDQSYRFDALLGRADVYGRSSSPEDIDKGIEDFRRVHADSQDNVQREFSLYRLVELLMAKKDHAKAAEEAKLYLDREKSGFSRHTPEVGLMLADSYRERKMTDDAIAMYVKVWSAHMGYVKVSAKAMKSWMELSWQRNSESTTPGTPSDRQGAYEGGARYLELTSRFKDKLTEEELELWKEVEALVKNYEANPNIKSVAQIAREKAGR